MKTPLISNVPCCHGKRDEWNGDYDCDYEFAGEIGCEDCICNYKNTGGRIDPRTGEEFANKKEAHHA